VWRAASSPAKGVEGEFHVGGESQVQAESKQLRQKRKEVTLCLPVAHAINELDATDYYVPDAEWQLMKCREAASADVVIMSAP